MTEQTQDLEKNLFLSKKNNGIVQEGLLETQLTFDDVLLVPKYSDIEHRAEVITETEVLPGLKLEKPFISSNMDTITEFEMAFAMADLGCLGILHRFMSIDEMLRQVSEYKKLADKKKVTTPVIVSVGVHDEERIEAAFKAGVRHFCIDVAHGHHALVKNTIKFFKDTYKDEAKIIAGNVCTYEGAYDLYDWGADCIKVGIGPGSVCSTRIKTGVGYPQLSAVLNCFEAKKDFEKKNNVTKYLIADGGIKNYGDTTKALAAGADAVMMGSIFAGCKQTPGAVWRNEKEEMIKPYRGMASHRAQVDFGIDNVNEEGIAVTVKYKGNVKHIVDRLIKGLRSGMSYCGSRTIKTMQEKREFNKISPSGLYESHPHKAAN